MSDEQQYSWTTTFEGPKDIGLEELIKVLAAKNKVRLDLYSEKKGWFKSTIDIKAVGDMNKIIFFQTELILALRKCGVQLEIEMDDDD